MTTEKDCIAIQFTTACVTGRTAVSRHGAERWARRLVARGACLGRAGGSWAQRGAGQERQARGGGGGGGGGGAGARVRAGPERGRARGSRRDRGAQGVRPGRWAPGLALGCALGALGLFLARFDSVFS